MVNNNVSIYVRNKDITPSSYYRIIQYAEHFDNNVIIREIAPYKIYFKFLNMNKKKKISHCYYGILYYITMLCRSSYYLLIDLLTKPEYIIVSKTFCPRYTPYFLEYLIDKVTRKSKLYWDFDDYIFESGEISINQASILESNSAQIIVTSNFLRSKVSSEHQHKVVMLPTTDGFLQGFNKLDLKKLRKTTFNHEIKLVWVATSGNIPSLLKIIEILDKTAKILKCQQNKKLTLVVVCNKPIEVEVEYLNIRNVKWTREQAREELYNAHIGLMPLIDDEYALGKGGFKLVQYIATGLPVIASDVGYNSNVVDEKCGILVDDKESNEYWLNAIIQIVSSWEVWSSYSNQAHSQWEKRFSWNYNLKIWKDLLLK